MSEPIRILHVFAEMNRGGAETMIMNLYRHIDRAKIQFDFIVHTQEKCAFDEEIEQLGGKIYRVPRYIGKNHFVYRSAWKNFFNGHREYKIIHGHVRSTASIYLKLAKKNSLVTIAHSHSTSSGLGFSSIIKNILQYSIRYIADYFIACSEESGLWLFGRNIVNGEKFFLLTNAIDINQFQYNNELKKRIRKELRIENKFVIGHIGRFHCAKNHIFIIDTFKKVYSKNMNSVLLLIGDGELIESIKVKVKQEKLEDSVIFLGVRADISNILQGVDVFLMPSLYEGLPVTLIEAQASGVNCVISDTITRDVMITDLVEFVSLKKAPEEWAEIIIKYKDNKNRTNMSDQINRAGYDIKSNVKELVEFYYSIIEN